METTTSFNMTSLLVLVGILCFGLGLIEFYARRERRKKRNGKPKRSYPSAKKTDMDITESFYSD